jgi:putative ABC transport system ATP-binding protein
MSIVKTENLTKIHGRAEAEVVALKDVSLSLEPGEFVSVMGPSGCGKSTLLHLIGGLDRPTRGKVWLQGRDLVSLNDDALAQVRRREIGFVFQFFNLIPVLSALENAALPLALDGVKPAEANRRAQTWLERMGLENRLHHRPDQLSGGQQQRVAIARALAAEPAIILADEPTGNLDSRAGEEIASLLRRTCQEWGRTILMVTHDPRIAAYADRIIFLKDGTLVDETRMREEGSSEEYRGDGGRQDGGRGEAHVRVKLEGL